MAGIKPSVSIGDDQRETVIDRLHQLVKDRPLRNVAKAWGVPRSTLNNYFYRGSTPKLDVLKRISEQEGVAVEWLISGGDSIEPKRNQPSSKPLSPRGGKTEQNIQAIVSALEGLDEDEQERLSRLVKRKGAEFLAQLLDEENICLLQLSGEKREAALILAQLVPERVREILSELRASRDMAGSGHQQDVDDQHKGVA
ncbi:XRE family transcriptional regulator [Salmonella enterica]|nr:XRE family transcriptional regulator [Salmonella enterica]EIS9096200.1 XRE family transcriptional regulator [Salmonella enterica]EIT2139950.1 XRE family transcriptional regulator [Salmonella enterica]ELF4899459.1 XRE family transcriptional regulator [Salmonella enterica]